MKKYYYDLHIHSCLSPCGDNDSTPDSIAGMGELNGLNIMALTDHNSLKNCPAFFEAARRHGIVPIAGMELTTAEDIHIICLFESLDEALGFDSLIDSKRIKIKNKAEIFGEQLIVNEFDEIIGTEENLLINATMVSLNEVPELVSRFKGICYPAHIDRESNGIISVLGGMPKSPHFNFAELNDRDNLQKYSHITGISEDKFLVNSDAHFLWNIKEKNE
ncbi:MAG: PHP domain-containing protein, partial [Clostridia bacterium]|nr:PHP domain-containing protein [Clostridia bacterium]